MASGVELVGSSHLQHDPRLLPQHLEAAERYVRRRFKDDPLTCQDLLEMLGLVPVTEGNEQVTVPAGT